MNMVLNKKDKWRGSHVIIKRNQNDNFLLTLKIALFADYKFHYRVRIHTSL